MPVFLAKPITVVPNNYQTSNEPSHEPTGSEDIC